MHATSIGPVVYNGPITIHACDSIKRSTNKIRRRVDLPKFCDYFIQRHFGNSLQWCFQESVMHVRQEMDNSCPITKMTLPHAVSFSVILAAFQQRHRRRYRSGWSLRNSTSNAIIRKKIGIREERSIPIYALVDCLLINKNNGFLTFPLQKPRQAAINIS